MKYIFPTIGGEELGVGNVDVVLAGEVPSEDAMVEASRFNLRTTEWFSPAHCHDKAG